MIKRTYVLDVEYASNSLSIQKRIEKCLLKPAEDSGYGFGIRDLTFYFGDKKSLNNAVKKLKKLAKEISIPDFEIGTYTVK
jgi:hypothetical protein